MKLNLVPTYVNEGKKTRAAVVGAVLIAAAGIVLSVGMAASSQKNLEDARAEMNRYIPVAQEALAESQYADKVMAAAAGVILNINLADAMKKHSTKYPDLYDSVRPNIPGFYRITSMSAAPVDGETCTVTLVGFLETQQQYADLMFALRRIKGVLTVSRAGYTYDEMYVPSISDIDQSARPRKRGDEPIPDDPLARLDYFMGQGTVSTFNDAGGYGSGEPGTRGAMPGSHEVTVQITMGYKLQTPNPRASLRPTGGGGGGNTGQTPGTSPLGGNNPAGAGNRGPSVDNDR